MYWTALAIGFLGNFHCIGMCGPIALSLPIGKLSKQKKVLSIVLYNLGRIFAYGFIGGIIGVFGLGLRYVGIVQTLSVFSGILLLFIGLFSLPKLRLKVFNAPRLFVNSIQNKIGFFLRKKRWEMFFFVGFFNGFLPCGLVYAGLVGSLVAGSWSGGVLYMMVFGLGTLPLMFSLPYIGSLITPSIRTKMRKVVPYSLMFFGLLFILRGSNLGIPYVSPKIESSSNSAKQQLNQNESTLPVMNCH